MEEDFAPLVLSSWKTPLDLDDYSHMDALTVKLRRLKCTVKDWERLKNQERKLHILDINEGISNILLKDSGLLSASNADKLKILQARKGKYWAHEITTQRLKREVQWIKEGDANTRFFHSFASARRNTNAIWYLNDKVGRPVFEDFALKLLGKQHFSELFGDDKTSNIVDQLKVIRIFPNMTLEEDIDCFLKPISFQEVEAVLKGFKKDKSPGPDGWHVDFFLAFFDLIWDELVLAVEQARTHGKIFGALNSTFLTLIPKCEKPSTFVDFRPISLCNLFYKIISKIAAL